MDNPLLNGIFVFVLGMLVIFLGMILIVLFVTLAGKIFAANDVKKKEEVKEVLPVEVEPVVEEDEIPLEVKAAIVAAISAYYFAEPKSKCDFIVRKIKRF